MTYGNYAPFYRGGYFNPTPMQTQTMPNMVEAQNQFAQPYQASMQPQQMPMQTPIQQMPMVQQMPTVQPSDDRIWVQGVAGAKAYFVAPNATVVLWDTESPTLYVKSADATGKPLDMEIIDLSRRAKSTNTAPENSHVEHKCQCGDKFVLKKDFEALESEISALREELNEIKTKPKTKPTKKIVEEAENE